MRVALLLIPVVGLLATTAVGDPQPDQGDAQPAEPLQPATTHRGISLGLDSLLRPRSGGWSQPGSRHGGKDEHTWRREFASQRAEVETLEASIDASQEQIRKASEGDWGYAPVQAGGHPTDPEVLKLRARLKRDKRSLDAARQRLRDLEIDASLAEVPRAWTEPPADPADVDSPD